VAEIRGGTPPPLYQPGGRTAPATAEADSDA
jgi:hypothetical protein